MTRRNYTKSFDSLKNRILAKITALTTIQYIKIKVVKSNRKINVS